MGLFSWLDWRSWLNLGSQPTDTDLEATQNCLGIEAIGTSSRGDQKDRFRDFESPSSGEASTIDTHPFLQMYKPKPPLEVFPMRRVSAVRLNRRKPFPKTKAPKTRRLNPGRINNHFEFHAYDPDLWDLRHLSDVLDSNNCGDRYMENELDWQGYADYQMYQQCPTDGATRKAKKKPQRQPAQTPAPTPVPATVPVPAAAPAPTPTASPAVLAGSGSYPRIQFTNATSYRLADGLPISKFQRAPPPVRPYYWNKMFGKIPSKSLFDMTSFPQRQA